MYVCHLDKRYLMRFLVEQCKVYSAYILYSVYLAYFTYNNLLSVTVIVRRNRIGDPSSKPGFGCLPFTFGLMSYGKA